MRQFRGQYFPGPFSSLLKLCTEVGWEVEPPFVVDLFRAPKNVVCRLAEQAWADTVATQHVHRRTMTELSNIDLGLVRLDSKKLSRLEHARVWALQSGANMANAQHSRYDNTKDAICPHCDVLDSVEHKVRFCKLFEACRSGAEQTLARWDSLPRCLTHHLLAPANPYLGDLQQLLQSIQDVRPEVQQDGGFGVWRDIFTGGTRLFENEFALAAWAAVDMTSGQVCGTGPLPGLAQTVPRAELRAAFRDAVGSSLQGLFGVVERQHICGGGGEPAHHWRRDSGELGQLGLVGDSVRGRPPARVWPGQLPTRAIPP